PLHRSASDEVERVLRAEGARERRGADTGDPALPIGLGGTGAQEGPGQGGCAAAGAVGREHGTGGSGMSFDRISCGMLGRVRTEVIAERAANAILGFAVRRSVAIDPRGRVFVEGPDDTP